MSIVKQVFKLFCIQLIVVLIHLLILKLQHLKISYTNYFFSVVLFHPDLSERPQVYGAAGSTIYVWTLEAGSSTLVKSLEAHHSTVTAMQITHDRKHLVRLVIIV